MITKRIEERLNKMEKKFDGMKDVFKWLEEECKAQKKTLEFSKGKEEKRSLLLALEYGRIRYKRRNPIRW